MRFSNQPLSSCNLMSKSLLTSPSDKAFNSSACCLTFSSPLSICPAAAPSPPPAKAVPGPPKAPTPAPTAPRAVGATVFQLVQEDRKNRQTSANIRI